MANMEKKVTIDSLAQMVARGFDSMDKRFDSMDKRFDQVEGRLDKVEGRIDKVEERFDRIENLLIRDHAYRIERLEDTVRVLQTAMGK